MDAEFAQARKEQKRHMRNKKFRHPPQRSQGPLRPPLWRQLVTDMLPSGLHTDTSALSTWVSDAWSALQSLDADEFFAVLSQQDCNALTLRSVVAFLDFQLQQTPPEFRVRLLLCLDAALTEWTSVFFSKFGSLGLSS